MSNAATIKAAREAAGLSAREAAGWSDAQLVQNGLMLA